MRRFYGAQVNTAAATARNAILHSENLENSDVGCQVVDMGLAILILTPRFVSCSLFRFLQLFDVFG